MTTRSLHRHLAAAGVAWLVPVLWQFFGPHDPATHRTLLSVAMTVSVMLYIDYRATQRDVLLRLGIWTGMGQRNSE